MTPFEKHIQKLTRIVLAGLEGTTIEPTVKVSETCWAVVRAFPTPAVANADDMARLVFAEVYHQVLSSTKE